MRQRSILLIVLAISLTGLAFSQAEFQKADKLLGLKAYDLAIKNYEGALTKYPNHAEGFARLGKAYFMTNQLLKSIESLEQAFALGGIVENDYKLLYGTALKKVGLYDKAESVFFKYSIIDPDIANHEVASIEYAKSILQEPEQYEVLSFEGNSDKSDFGTSFYNDQIVFCSFRDDIRRATAKQNITSTQEAGNQIFQFPIAGSIEQIEFLRPDHKENYNIGPLSYSADGRMVAYMRNNFTTGSNQIYSDESNMSIYLGLADENGDFADEKPFPYNQIEYSYAFPSLSHDGSTLYFASNRPGGLGGFDIYVSHFENGKWTAPENLGPHVNSAGDEITPYFDGETLYFASNHHYGLGGYDNFTAQLIGDQWSAPNNMGKGVNSPADDYYLAPNFENGNYYLTSNRLGGQGKDDIYVAYKLENEEPILAYENMPPLAVNVGQLESPSFIEVNDAPGNDEVALVTVSESEIFEMEMAEIEMAEIEKVESATATVDNLEGARLKAITFSEHAEADAFSSVYFIQLASLQQTKGDMSAYDQIRSFGQLYRFYKSSSVKIRLGYYNSRSEAEAALKSVKHYGFNDAFVTADELATADYEVIDSDYSGTSSRNWSNEYGQSSNYKVKLASYLDPLLFDVEKAVKMGQLEQWSKGKWTIFIISGYESLEAAKRAQKRAIDQGFVDAELVEDQNGILKNVNY